MSLRVLHLVSTLGPTAIGRSASRLIPAMSGVDSRVINLGESFFPLPAERIRFRSPLDLTAIRRLRELFSEFQPDRIHAWGPAAVRATWWIPRRPRIASHITSPPDWLTARQLRSALRILDETELISVEVTTPSSRPPDAILVSGGFDRQADLIQAIWAFDVVRHVRPDATLTLLGDGPERGQLESFAASLKSRPGSIRFVGRQGDVRPWLQSATLVWLTHRNGGRSFAAEATAAGVPTIGYDPGATLPLPHRDPIDLARRTLAALSSPPLLTVVSPVCVESNATRLSGVYNDALPGRGA